VIHGAFGLGYARLRDAPHEAYSDRFRSSDYSYDELVKIWNVAKRNERLHRLRRKGRALLKGVIAFLRGGGRIVSSTLIEALEVIIRELRVTTRRRILRFGEVKAVEMDTQYAKRGIFKWVPQLKAWLRDQTYMFWLGTLQISIKEYNPMVGVDR